MVFQLLEVVTQHIPLPAGQVQPVAPVSHLSHFGIPKLSTAASQVQVLVTVAEHQASKVVVVHIDTVPDGH